MPRGRPRRVDQACLPGMANNMANFLAGNANGTQQPAAAPPATITQPLALPVAGPIVPPALHPFTAVPTAPAAVAGTANDPTGVELGVTLLTGQLAGANGTIDLTDIDADFDGNDKSGSGYMFEFLKRVQERLLAELKKDGVAQIQQKYLKSHLDDNNYWIRAESIPKLASKLNYPVEGVNRYYLKDIKVWLPDTQFGIENIPCCISCGKNHDVVPHSFQTNHPARRIITFDTYYFLMSRTYRCKVCEKFNKSDNDTRRPVVDGQQAMPGTQVGRQKGKRTQYTFMGSHEDCLKRCRHFVRESFPAVLSAKSGLDKVLASSLRPLSDRGLSFKAMSKWLQEMHSLKFTRMFIAQQDQLVVDNRVRMLQALPPLKERLSDFGDPAGYHGAIPTEHYLSSMYKKYHKTVQSHMDKQQKFQVNCDQIAIDASFKATRKMTRINGKRVFNAMITLTNQDGMIRSQVATFSDSHEQITPALEAINETNKKVGKAGPKLVYTDKPRQDKPYFLEAFSDSLPAAQLRLNAIAEARNNAYLSSLTAPPKEGGVLATGAAAAGDCGVAQQLDPDVEDVVNSIVNPVPTAKVQLARHSTQIADKLNALCDVLGTDSEHYFCLDTEWDTQHRSIFNPYAKTLSGPKIGKVLWFRSATDYQAQVLPKHCYFSWTETGIYLQR